MSKLENNIFAKISLSIISLIITLFIVEVGLKTVGHFYNMKFQAEYIPAKEGPDYIRDEMYESYTFKESSKDVILSIGDSFTNAGNVESKYSYPHQLFNIFIDNKRPTTVLNMGLCEDSTFGVNKRLKDYLSKSTNTDKKPTKVLILIGAADNFERFQKEAITEVKPWYSVSSHSWYKSLSIYKVIRHIKYHYIQKELTSNITEASLVNTNELQVILSEYKKLKDNIHNSTKVSLNEIVSNLPIGFTNYCNNLHIDFNTEYELLHSLNVYMSKILASQFKHDEALKWLLDLASFKPLKFWGGEFDDAYFRIVQTFQFQSEYSASEILKSLDSMVANSPKISELTHFNEFYTLVKENEKVMKQTNINRQQAWKEIISLSKEYNFELYMLNYPSNYVSANSMIKKVSEENNIPLIDLNLYFNELIGQSKRDVYLEDDDHLTPLGYKLMAQEIHRAIQRNELKDL
ncbi:hypothetical protein BIY24_14740 [Halobacteriovorax marinus]|uniref:hypothetical protein n=1 Tax=Halobacteriovorax marinus TaxID=97084 RepID=UPI000BC2DD82|nr:hypothetical protein [Halobacteriovorax marinus]ATH09154.1 hypothetical protein BIY24_14740 [Halobacteriovorax marinus]